MNVVATTICTSNAIIRPRVRQVRWIADCVCKAYEDLSAQIRAAVATKHTTTNAVTTTVVVISACSCFWDTHRAKLTTMRLSAETRRLVEAHDQISQSTTLVAGLQRAVLRS
jgi:hypothetical protein